MKAKSEIEPLLHNL